ncbi:MAG TPA: sulfite exporter TauE/SafE family protein [Noviherbaspirillum sp.]|nr:sulfite exporter TauE/SafE family protein [Noviherbaspirillum sp.]
MLLITSVGLIFVLAGFVKGLIGLGLPTVAIGLLGLMMSPVQAVSLLVVPSLVTNLWQLLAGPALAPLVRRFGSMLFGFCVGTWGGASMFGAANGGGATTLLGLALIAYALYGLRARRFVVSANVERWMSPLVGTLTGVIAAATGVFVIPAVPYLQALELDKDELVQALGLSFTVSTLALAAALAMQGDFHLSVAGASLAALLPATGGMLLGQWVRGRMRTDTFRLFFLIGLLLLGCYLTLRQAF